MAKKHKVVCAKLIVNPSSGKVNGSGQLLEQIIHDLSKLGVEVDVAYSMPKEQAQPVAERAVKDGYELIIAMGGDDTIEATIRGIALASGHKKHKVTLGMIPSGTANNLAKGLGIPEDVKQACALIASGHVRKLDMGQIKVGGGKKLPFFQLATVGITAAVYPDALHASKGRLESIKGAIEKALAYSSKPKVSLVLDDDSSITVETMLALVTNVPLIGPNLLADPNASTEDGLLDVAVYPHFNKGELLAYFTRLMEEGCHDAGIDENKIQRYRARELKIKAMPELDVMADGVMLGKGPAKIKLFPGALRVIAPKAGSGVEKPLAATGVDLPAPVASATGATGAIHQGVVGKGMQTNGK